MRQKSQTDENIQVMIWPPIDLDRHLGVPTCLFNLWSNYESKREN